MRASALSSARNVIFQSAGAQRASSATSPVAAHARHDHSTTRAILLHIVGVAYAYGVRPRIEMWDDALLLIVGRDAKSACGPIGPAWWARILWRGLCEARSVRSGLRSDVLRRPGNGHRSHQDCRHADPLHHTHPDWLIAFIF